MVDATSNATSNRRGSTRHVEPGGTALCRTGATAKRYGIQDASKTGIALKDGPPLAIGTQVELELSWPMIGVAKGHGVVCRHTEDKHRVALRYTATKGMADLISNIVAIEQLRHDEPKPLLCGSSDGVRLAIDSLEQAGFAFDHARSPLGAMRILQDPWNPITSIVLSPTLGWLDFSVFVGSEYPQLRRLMLNEENSGANSQLAIDHSIVDLALRLPCEADSLYQALGLRRGDESCLSCKVQLASATSPFCLQCRRRSTDLDLRDDLGGGD